MPSTVENDKKHLSIDRSSTQSQRQFSRELKYEKLSDKQQIQHRGCLPKSYYKEICIRKLVTQYS